MGRLHLIGCCLIDSDLVLLLLSRLCLTMPSLRQDYEAEATLFRHHW